MNGTIYFYSYTIITRNEPYQSRSAPIRFGLMFRMKEIVLVHLCIRSGSRTI